MSLVDFFLFLVVVIGAAALVVTLSNLKCVKRLDEFSLDDQTPLVSVLVPARNEEKNIKDCISSLLEQDYPNYEVIVLDDNSTDKTSMILRQLKHMDSRLKVITGKPLPDGWPGKHWACQQLSEQASGEYLLFTDADTRHEKNAISSAMAAVIQENVDLLTAIPCEEVVTLPEKLVVPFMSFAILSFLPIKLVQIFKIPKMSVTIGQFMLFRKEAYTGIGEYTAACVNINDDVILGRMTIEKGYRWQLFNGANIVSCRMYHNLHEIIEGFGKNVFGFFEYRVIPYIVIWSLALMVFIVPPALLCLKMLGFFVLPLDFQMARIAVLEMFSLYLISYHRLRIPIYLAFFYPLTIFAFTTIAMWSMILTLTGRASWKGRGLVRAEVRLL